MDSRKVILLVGALVVAAITAFMARTLIMGTGAPQAAAVPGAPAAVPAGSLRSRALAMKTPTEDKPTGLAAFFGKKDVQGKVVSGHNLN